MKKTIKKPALEAIRPELLVTMPYEYPGKKIDVIIESEEFTCLCPWSGLPDFATVIISYVPDAVVIELKSLKMYLQSFRMAGIVHESAVNRILEDLVRASKPVGLSVEMKFNIRGGIFTTVKAQFEK